MTGATSIGGAGSMTTATSREETGIDTGIETETGIGIATGSGIVTETAAIAEG